MAAIELTNADAVHPGYGFLSENANFARILEENKINFIGASSKHIEMMGDKIQAKRIAKENGLPVIEGSEGGVKDVSEAKELCKKIGFPVLIKASGGGGGKGMKIVYKEEEFETLFSTAKSEAHHYQSIFVPLILQLKIAFQILLPYKLFSYLYLHLHLRL